jgi:hypothetical protein
VELAEANAVLSVCKWRLSVLQTEQLEQTAAPLPRWGATLLTHGQRMLYIGCVNFALFFQVIVEILFVIFFLLYYKLFAAVGSKQLQLRKENLQFLASNKIMSAKEGRMMNIMPNFSMTRTKICCLNGVIPKYVSLCMYVNIFVF